MKTSALMIVLSLFMFQTESLEKQALTLVQRLPVSDLDATLPNQPFAAWLNQQLGPQAGVIWQLTECSEPVEAPDGGGKDLRACMEINASLPDGRKVIVAVAVGTFKTGLAGKPALLHAVMEFKEQLYEARGLKELPEMLSGSPKPQLARARQTKVDRTKMLPVISSDSITIASFFQSISWVPPLPDASRLSVNSDLAELPPRPETPSPTPPPAPPATPPRPVTPSQDPQQDSEEVLESKAITRAKPVYPMNARKMNALGTVKVKITISETGQVIEAKAISGHLALREAAVEAAFRWVFRPTILNGAPVKAQGVLSFEFMSGPR